MKNIVCLNFRSEELRPESQLVLLAKLAANQPEPIWPLIVQLTLRQQKDIKLKIKVYL
jgi:hypothetical protein